MKNENNLIPEQKGAVVENDICAFSFIRTFEKSEPLTYIPL